MGPAFSLYLLPDEVLQFLKRCHLTCERTIRDLFASFNFRIVNPLFWKYGQCRSKSKTFNFWKLDWNFEIWTPEELRLAEIYTDPYGTGVCVNFHNSYLPCCDEQAS